MKQKTNKPTHIPANPALAGRVYTDARGVEYQIQPNGAAKRVVQKKKMPHGRKG